MIDRRADGWAFTVLVGIVAVVGLTAWLGRVDLLVPDEARHAEIAREMLASGEFRFPQIHGEPYYDKPVFYHWMVAAAVATFGQESWAARLPSVFSSLVLLIATAWWTGIAYGRSRARVAILLLATMPFVVALGRYVLIDMTFSAALTVAFARLGAWLVAKPADRRFPALFYGSLGLACLIKGPVAFVLGGVVGGLAACSVGGPRLLWQLRPFTGIGLALAVSAPWYFVASRASPQYIETFLWHHNVARFTGGGGISHAEPWFFFLLVTPLALLPWSVPVLSGVVAALGGARTTVADRINLVWLVTVVLFFSLSTTKLATYVLPAFAPLAALGADELMARLDRRQPFAAGIARSAVVWCVVVAVGATLAAVCGAVGYQTAVPPAGPRSSLFGVPALGFVLVLALTLAVASAAIRGLRAENDQATVFAASAASVLLFVLVYGPGADAINAHKGHRSGAAVLVAQTRADAVHLSHRREPHAVAFYAGRPFQRIADAQVAARSFLAANDAVLLTKRKALAGLGWDGYPQGVMELWSSGDGTILLYKPSSGGS